jgi:hypothetical protein
MSADSTLVLGGWETMTTTWPSRSGARQRLLDPHARRLDDDYSPLALGAGQQLLDRHDDRIALILWPQRPLAALRSRSSTMHR